MKKQASLRLNFKQWYKKEIVKNNMKVIVLENLFPSFTPPTIYF